MCIRDRIDRVPVITGIRFIWHQTQHHFRFRQCFRKRLDVYKRQAIYGARAANGVIIVTTKKGRTGKPIDVYKRQTLTRFHYVYSILFRESVFYVDIQQQLIQGFSIIFCPCSNFSLSLIHILPVKQLRS